MGNCVRKDVDNQWGGDYWTSPESSPEKSLLSGETCRKMPKRHITRENENSGDRNIFSGEERPTTEVKIKVTKKQLEELLGMKEVHGLTVEQVLTKLVNGGDEGFDFDHRSWCPKLQSIPE